MKKIVLPFAIGILVYIRFLMAIGQHFDIDEYAYLHWAAHVARGAIPFRDFFFFMPPGFIWIVSVIFRLFPSGLTPFVVARLLEFVVLCVLVGGLTWLFWQRKKRWTAMLVPIIFFFLPFPGIKFTELRPDTLALACVVLAMIATKRHPFVSGILYGVSLFILPKMAPAVVAGFLFLLPSLGASFAGFGLVVFFGLAWLLAYGGVGLVTTAIYSMIGIPLETSKTLLAQFPMPMTFFVPPNAFFYGVGIDAARLGNHALWVIAGVVAIWRLIKRQDLLIGVTLLSQAVFFLWTGDFHAQYFMPFALWVAWYIADGVDALFLAAKGHRWTARLLEISLYGGVGYLVYLAIMVYQTHWVLPMQPTYALLTRMWNEIPKTEAVFDLEGATLYYPDPYYVCCLPFGQTQRFLSRPFPSLSRALEETHTTYIYQGTSHRVDTLSPEDQAYIAEHFTLWHGVNEVLVRTTVSTQ